VTVTDDDDDDCGGGGGGGGGGIYLLEQLHGRSATESRSVD
jgi:hypothetical protein